MGNNPPFLGGSLASFDGSQNLQLFNDLVESRLSRELANPLDYDLFGFDVPFNPVDKTAIEATPYSELGRVQVVEMAGSRFLAERAGISERCETVSKIEHLCERSVVQTPSNSSWPMCHRSPGRAANAFSDDGQPPSSAEREVRERSGLPRELCRRSDVVLRRQVVVTTVLARS